VNSLHLGNCLEVLKNIPSESVHAVVTDPPYGISFMAKRCDYDVPSSEIWAECLRVLKPGGHLLAFAGTRTQHRMAVRIEDAGFEIRDMIGWIYGSGFPKSHNVSCSIDKKAGHGNRGRAIPTASTYQASDIDQVNKLTSNPVGPYEAKTDQAQQWIGWGTALKPAMEPITMARKHFPGTVADNVLQHETGALNIEVSRIPCDDGFEKSWNKPVSTNISAPGGQYITNGIQHTVDLSAYAPSGRWPANILHDGSEEVLDLFPIVKGGSWVRTDGARHFNNNGNLTKPLMIGSDTSTGSAARFFYCSKAGKTDRANNKHPTVKPIDLMEYLCRLVTPPGGIVLDPFMGSGTTGVACKRNGFEFIGIEIDPEYFEIARTRCQTFD
jgi:site-specific DNA-methyltransferase (adenine-specific)